MLCLGNGILQNRDVRIWTEWEKAFLTAGGLDSDQGGVLAAARCFLPRSASWLLSVSLAFCREVQYFCGAFRDK